MAYDKNMPEATMSRPTNTNDQLKILEDHPDYWLVKDARIPIEPRQNIILKPSGLQQIAEHYRKKYGITIYVHTAPIKIRELAELIHDTISTLKRTNPQSRQAGLIFISNDDPDDTFGHALPMIWQKDGQTESLIFLDTMQLLGETDIAKIEFKVDYFREKLLSLFGNLQLWAMYGHRQVDYSSCYTDALVTLKDGLREPSLKTIIENRIKCSADNITLFYAPEILLRTTQIISLIGKSNTNPAVIVHKQHSLETWIRIHSANITIKDTTKKFGTFTLFKAQKYAKKFNTAEENESEQSNTLSLH